MKKYADYKICGIHYTPSILFTIWNCSLPSLISLLTAREETTHCGCFSSFLHSILTALVSFCLFFTWLSRDQDGGKERNSGRRNHNNYTCAKVPCDRQELLQRSSEPIIHVHFSWDSFRSGGQQLIRYVFIKGLVLTLA